MTPARIAELLDPFLRAPLTRPTPAVDCHSEPAKAGEESAVLSPSQLDHISTYIDILVRWNSRINLTAIRDPEDIVPRHFGESIFAARHLFPRPSPVTSVPPVLKDFDVGVDVANHQQPFLACPERGEGTNEPRAADLGSGAGFPGLPIKLWAPNISLTLIESNHKKAAFLREVTRALTLTNVDIQNARAETLSTTFDLVTLRAVERFETILPTAAAMVAPAGHLALLISSAQQYQARATLPQLIWSPPVAIPNSRARILLTARHQ